ncbi:Arf-GAP with dual PH domain-containing protein 1 [Labeo rohita]|uniref:Arf-GAP with dual PH domain-containing protein 1 n=2 Tax=Labeonini TaxID=2743697 RepID=A0ABQ8MMT9_LABRO|nr:Arf-GAP with dual PH domain-containing protein 1 [Labeo rohita]
MFIWILKTSACVCRIYSHEASETITPGFIHENLPMASLLIYPEWGSCSLGVFICLCCSGVHRSIPSLGKVKSLRLSRWEDSEVQFMSERGNDAMNAVHEAALPVYYYKPTHRDCQVLKEQWIRAKYERQEFMDNSKKLIYEDETRDGMLMKRGRDNGQFLSRRFVLSQREGTLKYYTKLDKESDNSECSAQRSDLVIIQSVWNDMKKQNKLRQTKSRRTAKEPKAVIKVDTINACFQPDKIGNPNGLQITYLKDNVTRNIFVYHDSSREIVEWFNSIRAAQLHYLKVAFPGATDAELKPKLTRSFLKEGYMEKTGPRQTEGFKKRWFTLDHRRLMYFKDPLVRRLWSPRVSPATDNETFRLSDFLDAFAKGEVFLGHRDHGYRVTIGLPAGTHYTGTWQYAITIETPDRSFLFTCETDTEQKDWMSHFNAIISTPMSPQEYTADPPRISQHVPRISHLPERKREKRRTPEKPADTTESKTHTATQHKELKRLDPDGYSREHQRNFCMLMNGGLFYDNPARIMEPFVQVSWTVNVLLGTTESNEEWNKSSAGRVGVVLE